mmetsp:Transcript_96520/g.306185  ORF Transcript_96520/g.306185 Transcript_96520/m.306185 type:complete len:280 (+) Transcript_96520:11-850(+)
MGRAWAGDAGAHSHTGLHVPAGGTPRAGGLLARNRPARIRRGGARVFGSGGPEHGDGLNEPWQHVRGGTLQPAVCDLRHPGADRVHVDQAAATLAQRHRQDARRCHAARRANDKRHVPTGEEALGVSQRGGVKLLAEVHRVRLEEPEAAIGAHRRPRGRRRRLLPSPGLRRTGRGRGGGRGRGPGRRTRRGPPPPRSRQQQRGKHWRRRRRGAAVVPRLLPEDRGHVREGLLQDPAVSVKPAETPEHLDSGALRGAADAHCAGLVAVKLDDVSAARTGV